MRASFVLLATANMVLLLLTAATGLLVDGTAGWPRHFLLGVLSGLFTCMVHVVTFVYFVVLDKVFTQSAQAGTIDERFARQAAANKSRALRLGLVGIAAVGVAVALGGAVHVLVTPEVHLVAAFLAVPVNGIVFFLQYDLLQRHAVLAIEAFGRE